MKLAPPALVVFLTMPAFAQYAGPAILSRGEAPTGLASPQVDFRPFMELDGVYDTGLSTVSAGPQGQLANAASEGVEFTGGVSGMHSWRHTRLGLDYRGSIYHYAHATYFDGANQTLLLGVTHQFTRHTTLSLRESAGQFSQNFGLLGGLAQTVPFDPSTAYIPTTDFFDNRTIFLSSQADLTIQKSTRLSFDLGGDGTLVRRRSTALYGVSGAGARGDVQYRITRRSTVGVSYAYTHYGYHGVLGTTDLHSVVGTYSMRLSKNWEFSAYGGVMRSETLFLQNIAINPAIAVLLGIPAPVIPVRVPTLNYLPNLSARVSHTFSRGVAYVSAGHTVTPGNGLFLASTATTVLGGYAYTGLRRWSLSAEAAYYDAKSVGNIIGNYGSATGGITASRQVGRYVHAIAAFNVRKYQSPSFSVYNRAMYDVRIGFGFTPGDIPLRVW